VRGAHGRRRCGCGRRVLAEKEERVARLEVRLAASEREPRRSGRRASRVPQPRPSRGCGSCSGSSRSSRPRAQAEGSLQQAQSQFSEQQTLRAQAEEALQQAQGEADSLSSPWPRSQAQVQDMEAVRRRLMEELRALESDHRALQLRLEEETQGRAEAAREEEGERGCLG